MFLIAFYTKTCGVTIWEQLNNNLLWFICENSPDCSSAITLLYNHWLNGVTPPTPSSPLAPPPPPPPTHTHIHWALGLINLLFVLLASTWKQCGLGSVHKLREGGMGVLRGGDLKIFYTEKGGPEMLPEHWGENLKYLTIKSIKGSLLQSNKAV